MSRLFKESKGAVVDAFGVVHGYDSWWTDHGATSQYTDCGTPLDENARGEWSRLSADRHDTYLTCLGCVTGLQYGRRA
jgi:hypothetical protein